MSVPLPKKTATKVYNEGEAVRVRYHETDAVIATPELIQLNTGGWFTATTKRRMNQASDDYKLGFRVSQKAGKWLVDCKDEVYEFFGHGLELKRDRV